MALWGGRFSQGADSRFKQFNDSLRFDYRLAEQDIQGSMAWAKALVKVGVEKVLMVLEPMAIMRVLVSGMTLMLLSVNANNNLLPNVLDSNS